MSAFGAGAKKTGTTTTFGAKAAGTTSFGAKPAGTTGTTGFGAKPAGTSAFGAKPAGTSAFGAKPAGTTAGATGTTGATGTAGFGAKSAGTTGFGAKPAGFGAGAATTTTTTTAAAGSTAAAAGSTTAAAAGTTGFGRTAAGFGQIAGSTPSTGGFGATSSNTTNQADLQSLVARITELGNRLHPASPYCALKYVFYNRVDPSQVKYYRRPETFDPSLWQQAMALNPDPEHLVPHQACGYPDLKARLDAQDAETGSQASALADAETFLRLKLEEHSLRTALKLDQLKRDSLLLSHRLLTVSSHIEILRARGLPIQPDEDTWRQQLHNLLLQLSKPNEYRGRLNELSSRVRMQQQLFSQQSIDSNGLSSSSSSSHSDTFSSSDLEQFSKFLQHQQAGLEHLIDILNADVKNMQTLSDSMYHLKRD